MLDPHPSNELGKGLIDPEREAWLLSRGMVWACRVVGRDDSVVTQSTERPVLEVLRDMRTHGAAILNNRPWPPQNEPHTAPKATKKQTMQS